MQGVRVGKGARAGTLGATARARARAQGELAVGSKREGWGSTRQSVRAPFISSSCVRIWGVEVLTLCNAVSFGILKLPPAGER